MTATDTAVPSQHDPQEVFAETFDDGALAHDIGPRLTCHEVNALVGLLDSLDRSDGTSRWLRAHQHDCEDPHRHQ